MRRALIVSAIPPLPAHAGNRARILSLGRALRALDHEVHFAYLRTWPSEPIDLAAMRAEYGSERLHILGASAPAFPKGRMSLARRIARRAGVERAFTYALDDWYDSQVTAALRTLNSAWGFDVAIAEYVFLSAALAAFPTTCRKLIDTHDVFADRNARRSGLPRLGWYATSAAEEEQGLRRADAVLAIQEEEAAAFRARLGATPIVSTIGHIVEPVAAIDIAPGNAATFLGAGNEANLSAYHHFRRAILPHIVERMPDFRLYVGGAISDRLRPAAGVELVGTVTKPAELFTRAPITINPVRQGTGVNIKLLDALACGVPAVTTATGARGMPADARAAMRVVPDGDDDGFAEAILDLLADAPARTAASEAAITAARRWNHAQFAALRQVLA